MELFRWVDFFLEIYCSQSFCTEALQGFGTTINIINGGLECNKPNGKESPQAKNRIAYYKKFAWWVRNYDTLCVTCNTFAGTSMSILKTRSLAAATSNNFQPGALELCPFIGIRFVCFLFISWDKLERLVLFVIPSKLSRLWGICILLIFWAFHPI